jgi:3-hydroxyisobutyrate dehydrogenase-like beta-hydroxyacid dehydrogenase
MRVTFLGAGELADAFCRSLIAAGVSPDVFSVWARSLDDPARGRRARDLARDCGVVVTRDLETALTGADWVMSAVSGSQARTVAERVAGAAPAGAWYLDLNSSDPDEIRSAAALLEPRGWRVIDAGVMGPAPLTGHRTPIVLSGPHAAEAAAELSTWGFDVSVVGTEPGQASALKLLRNLIGKNFAAVVIEALLAAELLGVRETMETYVLEALQMDHPVQRVDRWVSGTVVHAGRRLKEQAASAAFVERAGGLSSMTRGTCDLLSAILKLDVQRPGSGQDPAARTIGALAGVIRDQRGV